MISFHYNINDGGFQLMSELIIQGIGFVAVLFFIASYQIKSNRALFLCQLIGCLIFCIQFFIMGAYTGALGLVVNITRNVLLLKIKDWKWVGSKLTLSGILLLLVAITITTWDGWISILPLLSVGISSIGYWTNNAQKIRASQLVASPCTLLYDIIIKSWGGTLSESITLISIIISIIRFGWNNLSKEDSEFNA